MPNTTSRLGLSEAVGADAVTSYRTSATSSMAILDNSMLVTEGTLASRPVVGAVEHTRFYRATDTAQWFVNDGTNWNLAIFAGPWQPLTTASLVSSPGGYSPAGRIEGDTVRLRGVLQNTNSSAIATNSPIFTVPAGLHPASNVLMSVTQAGSGASSSAILSVLTTGTAVFATAGPGFAAGYQIGLDGLTYTLS